MKPVLIMFYLYFSSLGFHLSGVVWSYPPNEANGATLASGNNASAAASGNGYQQGGGLGGLPTPSVVARLLLAERENGNGQGGGGGGGGAGAGGGAGGNNNNGQGSSGSGSAAFPIEENKCYKVSVSFDR